MWLAFFLISELVICGIGYHHAGLDPTDRRNIEAMFVKGDLPVLCKYKFYELRPARANQPTRTRSCEQVSVAIL